MKTPPENNFTERMLRRSSSMTLLRRRKILAAIEDETCDNLHETMHCNNRNSYISSSSTGTDELVAIIEMLNVEERVELSEEESEINCESKVIEDQDMDIFESPKTKRRCCSPNTKFTSFSPMAKTEIKSLADVDGIISSIPVTNKVKAPSEVEEFLENALEDELNNTMTNDHSKRVQESDGERTNANLDGSELISEVKTPFYKRITRFWNHERQSNSCNVDRISKRLRDTSTLNRSETFYRTLSYTIKKKIRAALTRDKSPEVALPNESQGQLAFDKDAMDMIENILENIKIQQGMIEQASKALSACRMSKELAGNSEEVESERLLLLAEIRKHRLQEQLKKLTSKSENIYQVKESSDMTEWAEVTIENINLSLRERLGRESLSEPMEWFLVVIIEGTNVWGTSLGLRPVGSMLFEFSQFRCIIDHLKPGFNITIEIYSLNLKSKVFCNDEDRSHTLNSTLNRTWTYLSPTKFFRRSERSPKVDPNQKLLSSSFIKSGHLQLGLNDLTLSSPWTLTAAPHDSILRDIIDLNLSCVLHLSASHEGFLNFGEPSGDFISWNRRFCALKGCTLMFWNYPRDQETKPPLKIIDLAQCCSQKISEVDKELCTRSQTVVLEVPRSREPGDVDSLLVQCKQTHTVQRYLLSYDNKKELIDWSSKLNNVLSTLRNWNVSSMKSIRISPAAASHQTEILRQLGSV